MVTPMSSLQDWFIFAVKIYGFGFLILSFGLAVLHKLQEIAERKAVRITNLLIYIVQLSVIPRNNTDWS